MRVIHCPVRMYCVYTAEICQLEAVWTSLGRPLQTFLLPAVCVLYKCGFYVMACSSEAKPQNCSRHVRGILQSATVLYDLGPCSESPERVYI